MKTIYFALLYIGLLSEVLALILLYKKGFERLPEIWKPLFYLILSGFISDFLSVAFIFFSLNNYWLLYIYGIVEINCFLKIFKNTSKNEVEKFILTLLMLVLSGILIFEFFQTNGNSNNLFSNVLNKIIIIFFSGYFSLQEYRKLAIDRHSLSQLFIFLIILFYSLSTFYYSIFEELIKSEMAVYLILWPIPIICTILFNFLVLFVLWRKGS